mmetsp:Transcript_2351/g.3543  ORF Transcript_2351/g.3543 Transcript_2351/m.3543 type:complete len:209 (+) Transcript_2351:501-1127(+)
MTMTGQQPVSSSQREQQERIQANTRTFPSGADSNFNYGGHSRLPSTAPAGVERERPQYSDQTKQSIINLVQAWPIDALLTEQLQLKIIKKVQVEDGGIMGAYRLYLTDHDLESFKARVIHKVLGGHLGTAGNNTNMTLSAEERQSSMTTAGFNRSADYLSRFSRGSTTGQQNPPFMRPSTNATNSRYQRIMRPTTAEDNQGFVIENQS